MREVLKPEVLQHAEGPAAVLRPKLIDGAVASQGTTTGNPEEVAVRIPNETAGSTAVGGVGKRIERHLAPSRLRRRQLVYRLVRGPIEISGAVEDDAAKRTGALAAG